jgi:hypothetical protein
VEKLSVSRLIRGAIYFALLTLFHLYMKDGLLNFLGMGDKPPVTVTLNGSRTAPYLNPVPVKFPRPSHYYYAPVGQKILICNVSLLYDGKDQGTIACRQSHFVMQDSKGEHYQSAAISERWIKEAQLLNIELNYQGRMRGDVIFVVPQSVEAIKVEYRTFKKEREPLF